jgi:hypothetical protein
VPRAPWRGSDGPAGRAVEDVLQRRWVVVKNRGRSRPVSRRGMGAAQSIS